MHRTASLTLVTAVALALGTGAAAAQVRSSTNATPSNAGANASSSSFARGGAFSNDSGNGALGTSPGQTSSGTAAGNSSAGIDAGSTPLATANVTSPAATGVLFGDGVTVPAGGGVDVNGERMAGAGNATAQQDVTVLATPLLDQTTRAARAREQRRRAQGAEPRIIGIAPRTDSDLTHQMPDDRIIRY